LFIVFGLDGTLIDGYDGITDALGFALERLGRSPLPIARVRGMVGEGLERLVEKSLGSDPELVAAGVRLFRERYSRVADSKTRLLPDVPEVLAAIGTARHTIALASNKPPDFSRRILAAKGIAGWFAGVGGPGPGVPPKPDGAMLRRLMSDAGAGARETVVVGDMEIDSTFGRSCGCRVVLVAGGSRSGEELASVDADAHLTRLAELPPWLARVAAAPDVRPTIGG
jgi:phosphoglycolate phosphatase